jgi:hypothetical protein
MTQCLFALWKRCAIGFEQTMLPNKSDAPTTDADAETANDAREIRERYAAEDVSYADLAEQYPVTASGIWHVVTGAVFADAGGPTRRTTGEGSH